MKRIRLRVGQRLQVTVGPLTADAAPWATSQDGARVRVPGGAPGDQLAVEVVGVGQHSAWSRIRRVLAPGAARVEAPCPVVDTCGGCPWQHIDYGAQLAAKTAFLRTLFDGHPAFADAVVEDPKGISQPPFGYRTKIQMPVAGADGGLIAGFWATGSRTLVPVEMCAVQDPAGERVRRAVLGVLNAHAVTPFVSMASGELRSISIRVASGTGQIGVVLVVTSGGRRWEQVGREILTIPGVTGVWLNVNDLDTNAVFGPETRHLAGESLLTEEVGGVRIEVSPVGFFQTNPQGAAAIIAGLRALAPPSVGHLVDLYAGSGLLGLALADRAQRLTAIEAHDGAAESARHAFANLTIPARVITATVESALGTLSNDGLALDVVIADPPRSGLHATALEALGRLGPPVILYVSCNPETFCRDASGLAGAAYAVSNVIPIDMFPHGPHLELVAKLTRTL